MKWWGQRKRLTTMQDALFSEYLTRRQNHQAGLKVKTRYSNGKQTWELTRILIYSYGFPIRLGTGFGLFCFWITPSLTSGSAFLTYSDAKHPVTDKPRLSASNVFSPSIGTSRYQWCKRRKGKAESAVLPAISEVSRCRRPVGDLPILCLLFKGR